MGAGDAPAPASPETNRARLKRLLAARPGGVPSAYPLSYSQSPNWLMHQSDPGSSALNEAVVLRVSPAIDVPRVNHALRLLIERHPVLCSTFALLGETPLQRVLPGQPAPLDVIDATRMGQEDLDIDRDVQIHRPFNLARGPVFRAQLWSGAASGDVLLLVAHHLVIDGIAYWTVMDELFELYRSLANDGLPPKLPESVVRYPHYVQWQRELVAGPEGQRQATYWRRQLGGANPLLPLSRGARAVERVDEGGTHPFELEQSLVVELRDFAEREGMTMYTLLLAAFQLLLHGFTGADDILVSSPTNDRLSLGSQYRGLVGDCSNRVLLRSRMRRDESLAGFLKQTSQTVRAALENHNYPISLVTSELSRQSGVPASSIGDVAFNMLPMKRGLITPRRARLVGGEEIAPPQLTYGELSVGFLLQPRRTSRRTLVLEAIDSKARVGGILVYRCNTFEPATISRLARDYERLLHEVANDRDRPVAQALGATG